MPYIPPELNDHIIDFLHDDRRALKACSLTSRSWRPAARYHLYKRLSLPSLEACRALCEVLDGSPFLAGFTREVSISNISPGVTPNGRLEGTQAQELDNLWSTILPALIAVERLDISFLKIDDVFQAALHRNLNTIAELSIQYCRFQSFFDLVAAVHSFSSLKNCTLRGVSWNSSPAPVAPTPLAGLGACPKLARLTLGRDLPLEALVSWFLVEDVGQELTQLSACCSSIVDAVLLSELIRAASPTLKDLELDWYSSSYNDLTLPIEFSLGPSLALESLTLRCPIAISSTVPWVTSLLAQVNPASLRIFRLEVRLLGSLVALSWADLDNRLLQSEFAKLTTVEVKILAWHTATGISEDITTTVHRLLPQLHSKGMLRVQCL